MFLYPYFERIQQHENDLSKEALNVKKGTLTKLEFRGGTLQDSTYYYMF